MMKFTFSIILTTLTLSLFSQQKITLTITQLPSYHPANSDIYLAGSFNGWNPQDNKFKFEHDGDGKYKIKLKLDKGAYEYKVTRGGWDKVECKKDGSGVSNRELVVVDDADINIAIEEWQDRFPTKPRVSSASAQVSIIDTAFLIPQLGRTRRVWIYLPKDYNSSNTKYPVLYMHDGQNLFDDATSFSGEWGIDEFMDTTTLRRSIVVGIDHGGQKRLNEYSPYDMDRFGKGEGDAYVDFLVKTLKPYIDKHYRTYRDKQNTFIAGSSMGGLISMYAVLKYPKVFGGAGIFSPAFWVAPKIYDYIKLKGRKVYSHIYFYAGKLEDETMVPNTLKAMQELSKLSTSPMESVIRDEGRHNEPRWRMEFPGFYRWLVGVKR